MQSMHSLSSTVSKNSSRPLPFASCPNAVHTGVFCGKLPHSHEYSSTRAGSRSGRLSFSAPESAVGRLAWTREGVPYRGARTRGRWCGGRSSSSMSGGGSDVARGKGMAEVWEVSALGEPGNLVSGEDSGGRGRRTGGAWG